MKRLIIISLTIIMFFFKNSAMSNNQKNFYNLEIESINGEIIKLKDYRDKVILIVNTASYCGFTKQYEDLAKIKFKFCLQDTSSSVNFPFLSINEFACAIVNFVSSIAERYSMLF